MERSRACTISKVPTETYGPQQAPCWGNPPATPRSWWLAVWAEGVVYLVGEEAGVARGVLVPLGGGGGLLEAVEPVPLALLRIGRHHEPLARWPSRPTPNPPTQRESAGRTSEKEAALKG
jgi:hypothetical protein